MKSILIGNSICNGLEQPNWTVISLPGANWETVERHIKDHLQDFQDAFVYIHVGPVRFTTMERGRRRREVVLGRSRRQSLRRFWTAVVLSLAQVGSVPVLCTLYPMDFIKCNRYYANAFGSGRGHRIHQGEYGEWNERIKGMVVIENRGIVAFNERNTVVTPFLHRTVFLRRRSRYVFRSDRFLEDGIHPKPYLKNQWRRALVRAHQKNLTMWREFIRARQ